MCQSRSEVVTKSTEDITCYKVLQHHHLDFKPWMDKNSGVMDYYTGPYQMKRYEVGGMYVDNRDQDVRNRFGDISIHGGFFHFMRDMESARRLIEFYNVAYPYSRYAIAKCTIPKGTDISRGLFMIAATEEHEAIRCSSICARKFKLEDISEDVSD